MSAAVTTAVLQAESTQFTSSIQQSRAELRKLRTDSDGAVKGIGSVQGALSSLKSGAGRGSELDELGKTLRGAGAVAGLTLMGEAVKGVAENAVKLKEEFQKGELSATGLGVKLAEGVPVIGNFVTAGQSIRELFTGEQAQIDHINESIKTGNEEMEARVAAQKVSIEGARSLAEETRKVTNELMRARALTPIEIKAADEAGKQSDAKAQRDKDLAEYTAKVTAARDKDLAAIRANGAALKKTLEEDAKAKETFNEKMSTLAGGHGGNRAAADRAGDRLRDAGFQADMAVQGQLAAAKKRAADDIATYQKGLDKNVADEQKARYLTASNDSIKKKFEEDAKAVKGFFDTVAKAGHDVNEAAERTAKEKTEKQIEQLAKLKSALADLRREADQAGMSAADKRADDLKRDGATGAQQAEAKMLADRIDAAEKFKTDQEEAKRLIEESRTPLQKFQDEAAKVQKLLAEGLITQAQADAETKRAGKELTDATKFDPAKKAPTLERRFDFRLPKDPQASSDTQRQIQAALEANKIAADIQAKFADVWRILIGNQNPFQPVGFNS
jgi:hypothetical protein